MLQLGKEKFIDILKDQHPDFNQSASNDVLVSLNENACSKCTAFKIFISILFIAFDDMKSSPFVDEIHWAFEYLKLATRNAIDVCAGKKPLVYLHLMLLQVLEADLNYREQCCQLSGIIRETPDFEPFLPVSRLESEISRIVAEVCYFL